MKTKRTLKIVVVTLLGLTALGVVAARMQGDWRYTNKHRRRWKDEAIAEVDRLAGDADWLASETAKLKSDPPEDDGSGQGWLSDHLILMKNGDWVVYASQCHKQDWRVYDIFVGRACDGKWYYSSYHFCIEMINLTVNGQPSALPAFVEQYYLSQFDGKSDEALQKTWPPSADP